MRASVVLLFALGFALSGKAKEDSAGEKILLDLLDFDTFAASFTQKVFDDDEELLESSRGRVWIDRPLKFRWEYYYPIKQILVSDGEKLTNYDPEIQQAVISPLLNKFSQLPMILLLGQNVPEESYTVETEPRSDGFDWLVVRPRDKEADFVVLRFAYRAKEIKRMELTDLLSQKSVITFNLQKFDEEIKSSVFWIYLPPEVDITENIVAPKDSTFH